MLTAELPRVMTAAQYQAYLRTGRIDAQEAPTVNAAPSHTFGVMNGLESKYSFYLEALKSAGKIEWWLFEKITLRLAKRTNWTPDFLVKDEYGACVFHETKGPFAREDSRVKAKLAAEMFRNQFAVVWVTQNATKTGWVKEWL